VQFIPGQEIDAEVAQIQIGTLNGKVRSILKRSKFKFLCRLMPGETERLLSCVKTLDEKLKLPRCCINRQTEKAFGGTVLPVFPPLMNYTWICCSFLSLAENGKLFDFESTYLIEHAWQLSAKDASLRKVTILNTARL